MSDETDPPSGLHLRIAGDPTAEEIAAVVAVVTALAAAAPPPSVGRSPAWARASRFEQLGQAAFQASTDPRLVHRPSGGLPPGSHRAGE